MTDTFEWYAKHKVPMGVIVLRKDGLHVDPEDDHYSGTLEPAKALELATSILSTYKPMVTKVGAEPWSEVSVLPDGSAFTAVSMPLPADHWLTAEGNDEPPMPMRCGISAKRSVLADQIKEAARYAIRASTMNGKNLDFDPDAMVQNLIVGLLGYYSETGR